MLEGVLGLIGHFGPQNRPVSRVGLVQGLNPLIRYNSLALSPETQVDLYPLKVGFVANSNRFGPNGSTPGAIDLLVDQVIPHCCKVLMCPNV